MRRTTYFIAVVIAACVLAPLAHGFERSKRYIYDEAGSTNSGAPHNLAIVIDVEKEWVNIQSKAKARVGSMYAGVGGSYVNCGNEAFYCLTGPLEIVIPKTMSVHRWNYHGLVCRGVRQMKSDIYDITCRSPKYQGRPSYTYSISRGVLSISSSPVAGEYRYELRGERGLFSPGNNP